MDVNSMSLIMNDRLLKSTCFYKLFYYLTVGLLLNCLLNGLNFGILIIWIVHLKIGF